VPTKKQSDAAIAEAIVAALNRNKWIDPNRIDVVVENGVVTLSGTVMNWAARRGANDIAAYTPGVVDIQDNLVYE
jgi:osmotically-inducible protein OsmY